MATFDYTAMDSKGKEIRGTIEADNQNAAVSRIREKGLFPTGVVAAGAARPRAAARPKGGRAPAGGGGALKKEIKLPSFMAGRVKAKQLMIVTRQLATLIDAGLPLLRGLQVIQRQERNPKLKSTIGELAESIQSGSTLAEAMSQHPRIFNRLYVNMVKAGEVGGVLDVVLLRLAEFMEKSQKIRNKVISAMTYPIVVMVIALAILYFLMTKIVPKFQEVFADIIPGGALPPLTQLVMNASHVFVQRGWMVAVAIIVVVIGLNLLRRVPAARRVMDSIKLGMPIFGPLTQKTAIGRFARTLGTLLSSGVPILQALNIVRDTAGNEVVARAVTLIHDSVKEGENIAPPIEASGVFPPMVVSMVEVGEETGKLPDMLNRIGDAYDDEVDNTVAALSSILEPLLIVGLALMVGTIVIAIFLPMLQVIGQIGQGR
jgi:type IV pilus assembly protein PilC